MAARGGAGARAACAWSVPALEPRVAGMPRHPHLAFARAFHVDPSDKDQWEAFILGLPATLKRDIKYRKKLFYEVDKGARARATTRRARRPKPEPRNPRPIFSSVQPAHNTLLPRDSSRLADHDGKVSMDELQAFLEDVNLDASTARTLMSVADCSHDGKLCIEEFSDMIHAYLDNPRFEVD